jgi:lipopolysaccharide/colanic/teichoic acid biosynthesis glycosyltransferase
MKKGIFKVLDTRTTFFKKLNDVINTIFNIVIILFILYVIWNGIKIQTGGMTFELFALNRFF